MRVNDIFNYCTVRGYFDDAGTIPPAVAGFSAFLVVATISDNVIGDGDTITIGDNPHKHIGIHLSGKIWNFSNGKFMVVADTLDEFINKMKQAYSKSTKFLYAYRQDI